KMLFCHRHHANELIVLRASIRQHLHKPSLFTPPNNPHRFCEYCICFCCIYCTKYRILFRCCIRIVFINRPHALWFCALCVDVARFDSYYFVHWIYTSTLVTSLITSSASTTSETVEQNESNVKLSCSAKR